MSMLNQVGTISLGLTLDSKPVVRQANDLQNKMQGIGKKLGTAVAAGLSVKALVSFSKKCLELGSDLAEVQNVVDTVFPHMSSKIDRFAENAAARFGMSETMAKKFTGTFGAMASSFGFSEKEAAEMSTTLTGLAGDVASFYNSSQEEAYTKLKSVFTGETESLKELGVVMTQTALDQYAMENGIGRTTAKMSEQEKVALRYRFVLDKLSNASGDFSRTSGSWANQVRLLKLQFDSLCATVGQGLIAALTPAIRALNNFMGALVKAANTFKSFVYSLFGLESEDMSTGAAATMADTMSDLGDSTGSAASGLEGVGDAAGGAAKDTEEAAKKIQRSLMGFDRINKLSDTSADSSGSGSGSGGSGSSGTGSGIDTSSMLNGTKWDLSGAESPLTNALVDMFKKAWNEADFSEIGNLLGTKLKQGLDGINWEKVKESANKVAKSVATLLNGFLETENLDKSVGHTVAEALNTAFGAVNTFVEEFHWDSLGKFVSGGIQEAFRTFDFGNVTKFVSGKIKAIFEIGSGLLQGIDWKAVPKDICDAIKEAFDGFDFKGVFEATGKLIGSALVALIDLNDGIVDLVMNFFKSIAAYFDEHIDEAKKAGKSVWQGILNGIAEAIINIGTWIKENILDPFIKGFKEAFGIHSPASNPDLVEAAKNVGQGILDAIAGVFTDVKKWVVDHIISPIKNAMESAKEKVELAVGLVKSGWTTVKDWVSKNVGGAFSTAVNVTGKLVGNAWGTIRNVTESLTKAAKKKVYKFKAKASGDWKTLKGYVSSVINKIKDKTANITARAKGAWDSIVDKAKSLKTWVVNRSATYSANSRGAWSTIARNAKTTFENVKSKTATFTAKAAGAWTTIKNTLTTVASQFKSKVVTMTLKFVTSGWDWVSSKWKQFQDWIKKGKKGGGVYRGGFWRPVQSYAGGGNPPGGQIFRARENGNPELVGTIRGSTSVMNNDQIVASVSHGVAQAIAGLKFYSQDRYTPHLANVVTQAAASSSELLKIAQEAQEASRGASLADVISILRDMLEILKNLDLDIKIDGISLKQRIVRLINANTQATGRCEIIF